MANVRTSLTLQSNGVMTSPLNLSVTSTVLADSGSLIRGKVLGVAAGSDATVIYKASDKLESAYIYIRNLATEREKLSLIHISEPTRPY